MLNLFILGASITVFALVILLSKILRGKQLINFDAKTISLLTRHARKTVFILAFLFTLTQIRHYPNMVETALGFGTAAMLLLFSVYVPGLMVAYFPSFKLNGFLVRSRRAVGVSAFAFALIHFTLIFTYYFGARIDFIFNLLPQQQLPVFLGDFALIFLTPLFLTSTDWAVQKLSFKNWKLLHRLVYPATVLVTFHAFLIGPSFSDPYSLKPLAINFAALTLLLLKSFDFARKSLKLKSDYLRYASIIALAIISLTGIFLSYSVINA